MWVERFLFCLIISNNGFQFIIQKCAGNINLKSFFLNKETPKAKSYILICSIKLSYWELEINERINDKNW